MIRVEKPSDKQAVHNAVAAAFEHTAEANLVDAIRESSNFIPDLSMVAEVDGEVVGHVMISWGVLSTARTDLPIPMLAPLAVAPEFRGRGIGSELVRAVCAAADRKGLPLVVLEGGPKYYGRFGFEQASEYGIEMPLPDWAPREAGQILTLSAYEPGLIGTVIYPPYFAAADAERQG